MKRHIWVLSAMLMLCAILVRAQRAPALVIDGARLIVGDGTVIERAAIVVENGRIARVGDSASVRPPAGARRVDAAGKTIIPSLVDGHVHLGFQVGLTFSADNYTRATLVDQLNRYAYAGIGAVLSMGTDAGDMPLRLRAEQTEGARFLLAGRGLDAPNAGPATPALKPAAYGVETEGQARQYVRDLVAQRVDLVKIWVDDRNGTVQKLAPPLYRAIIDEAHKHGTKVVAHVFYLDDAKDLARAGVDAFAHLVRDKEVDDELIGLLKQHHVLVMPNMAISENGVHATPPSWLDEPLTREVVSADALARLRSTYAQRSPDAVARARRTFETMQKSLAKMNA